MVRYVRDYNDDNLLRVRLIVEDESICCLQLCDKDGYWSTVCFLDAEGRLQIDVLEADSFPKLQIDSNGFIEVVK